ncbi:MAG: hypothetical protein H9W81_13550 [Enterococcus sp.]|nr:hypothetical protein [Enterococcus sp.]
MDKVLLGSWLIQYNGSKNALRVLINDEYLLDITEEKIDAVLEILENYTEGKDIEPLWVQPMVRQELISSYEYYTEDGEPEEVSNLNYDIGADKLSAFYVGSLKEVRLDFSDIGDAKNFFRDIWEHPAMEWIIY